MTLIRALRKRRIPFFIIHTGQHYSYNMDQRFFEELELPEPRYSNDAVRNKKFHGEQTAEMITFVERALLESRPGLVIVGGDANANLAAAVAYVEAAVREGIFREVRSEGDERTSTPNGTDNEDDPCKTENT